MIISIFPSPMFVTMPYKLVLPHNLYCKTFLQMAQVHMYISNSNVRSCTVFRKFIIERNNLLVINDIYLYQVNSLRCKNGINFLICVLIEY